MKLHKRQANCITSLAFGAEDDTIRIKEDDQTKIDGSVLIAVLPKLREDGTPRPFIHSNGWWYARVSLDGTPTGVLEEE